MSEPGRSCGDCSLCCKVFFVGEFEKPAGEWCRHATPGKGCGIHETRPNICREFLCLWLLQPKIPDALKPSRSKVILTASHATRADGGREQQLLAHCDASDPTAWRREPTYGFLKAQTQTVDGRPQVVMVWAGKRVWLLTAQGDIDLGEASGTRTFDIRLGDDGKPYAAAQPPG